MRIRTIFGVEGLYDSAFWELAFNAVREESPKQKVDLKVIILNSYYPLRYTEFSQSFTEF